MSRKRKYDLLLVAGLLLAAVILYLLLRPGGPGVWAVVTVDGRETARYALSEDRTVILGEENYNILQISNGKAAVMEANCGDHTCIRTGKISREGESIIWLPHRLIIRIEGGVKPDFDAVVR